LSPTSVSPQDPPFPVGLSLSIPATLPQASYAFSVTGTSNGVAHSVSGQFAVGGITGSILPAADTISVGGNKTFAVSLTGQNGYAGNVNLNCKAPVGLTCSFSPLGVNIPAMGSATAQLTIQVSQKPSSSSGSKVALGATGVKAGPFYGSKVWLLFAGICLLPASFRNRRVRRALSTMTVFGFLVIGLLSCGGGSNGSGGGGGGGGGNPVTVQVQVAAASNNGGTASIGSVTVTVP
jgi:hypothetical protein